MAKKKASRKTKSPKKRERRPWWLSLLRFPLQSPARYFILAVFISILLFWQWEALVAWAGNVRSSLFNIFGWGFIFIVAATGFLVYGFLNRHLHKWHCKAGA